MKNIAMVGLSHMEATILPGVSISPVGRITHTMTVIPTSTTGTQGMVPSPTPVAQVLTGVATGIQLMAVLLAITARPATWKDYLKSRARFASHSHVVLAIPGRNPQLRPARGK